MVNLKTVEGLNQLGLGLYLDAMHRAAAAIRNVFVPFRGRGDGREVE